MDSGNGSRSRLAEGTEMSSTLYWFPIKRTEKYFGDGVKNVLKRDRPRYDQNLTGTLLTAKDIPFLEGMVAAGLEEAKEVIKAIEKYKEIQLDERY